MADEDVKNRATYPTFKWKRNTSAPSIYSNYLHVGWTLDDVRITFGALRSAEFNDGDFYAEEQGSAVLTWRQAKSLQNLLNRVVSAYESRNGTIEDPQLAEEEIYSDEG